MKNIFICLAHNYPALDVKFCVDLFTMQEYFNGWSREHNNEYRISLAIHGGYNLDKMRDDVTKEAINNGADYLLFLDTDMSFPQDTIVRMVNVLDANPEYEAVSGLYTSKKEPYLPQIFAKYDEKCGVFHKPFAFWVDRPFPIVGCGAGILMVKSSAIKKIKLPYFKFIYEGEDKKYPLGIGEDLYFCLKLYRAGVKMICDPGVSCGHYDRRPLSLLNYINKNGLKIKNGQIIVTKKQLREIEKKSKSGRNLNTSDKKSPVKN